MPGRLPYSGGERPGGPAQPRVSPLQAAVALGEYVRTEHGRAGAQRFVAALSPLLPGELLEQAAASSACSRRRRRTSRSSAARRIWTGCWR